MIFGWDRQIVKKEKRPDFDSIFDSLSKTIATNIDKYTVTDSISQLITLKILLNKNILNCSDPWHLNNVDQSETKLIVETKSDKTDVRSVKSTTTPSVPKKKPQTPIQKKHPCYKISNKFMKKLSKKH